MKARHARIAGIVTTPVQGKPWGTEVIFATGENGYVGKVISVGAGQALSLQYHREKDETISVVSGELVFEHGPDVDHLDHRGLRPGDTVHLPPTVVHRITAVTDVVVVEASTAGPGWRDDVVRLSDRYGRTGTSRPDPFTGWQGGTVGWLRAHRLLRWVAACTIFALAGTLALAWPHVQRFTTGLPPEQFHRELDPALIKDYPAVLGIAHNAGNSLGRPHSPWITGPT